MNGTVHIPVLLEEVVSAVTPGSNEIVVDGTFGGGGYSRALLKKSMCRVVGIDRDLHALERGKELVREFPGRLTLVNGTFGSMKNLLSDHDIDAVDAVMLDLGLSSDQLNDGARGFSFQNDGELDMRMGSTGISAAWVLNTYSEQALAGIIYAYGEEDRANAIARAIVTHRVKAPLTRTSELANLCTKSGARGREGFHPATRTFQALRIYVNDELGELARGLSAAEQLLRPGGRLAVVSFHSLEDRMVKRFFSERAAAVPLGSRHLPSLPAQSNSSSFELHQRKAVMPSRSEAQRNPRSRSAKLRVGIRTGAPAIPFDAIRAGLMPEVRV